MQDDVEAIDLNLGCPQNIAKKGHYGSYLQDEWSLIRSIVSTLHRELQVPTTVKIRVFEDPQRTVEYARMIEAAGAQILTVHGRQREQRGGNTGLADWEKIKLVKQAVSIPVFANGNILFKDDLQRCVEATGADGVMTAEGNLYNPAIFEDRYPLVWDMVTEYLDICRHEAPAPLTAIRGHLFKLFRPCLDSIPEERTLLGVARSFDEVAAVADRIIALLKHKYEEAPCKVAPLNHSSTLTLSPEWFCRSHIRDKALFAASYPCAVHTVTDRTVVDAEPAAKVLKVDSSAG